VVSSQKDQHKQWQEAIETARNYTKLYTALDQELMEGTSPSSDDADDIAKSQVEKHQAEVVEIKDEKEKAVAEK
jgi:hypothetical protein